jgi:drug/metabolite transporter (DMT)-like permease
VRRDAASETMLLGAILLWSLNVPLVKVGIEFIDPLAFAAMRFVIAAAVLAIPIVVRGRGLAFRRADLPLLVTAALLGLTVQQVLVVLGLKAGTASSASILFATTPLWAAALATAAGQERPGLRNWGSLALGLAGVALVVLGSPAAAGSGGPAAGVLILGAAFSWAAYSVIAVPLLSRYPSGDVSAAVIIIGALGLVPFGLPGFLATDFGTVPLNVWAILAYAAIGALVVSNVLYFRGIRTVGASRATAFSNLQPVFGVAFAMLLLGETLSILQVVGGAVVLAGILLGRRVPRREGIVASEPDV